MCIRDSFKRACIQDTGISEHGWTGSQADVAAAMGRNELWINGG